MNEKEDEERKKEAYKHETIRKRAVRNKLVWFYFSFFFGETVDWKHAIHISSFRFEMNRILYMQKQKWLKN